jgi:benzoyl-CoA reductase/2-hydroxyglutaryl-CoA dehydratase subunit BcrC/BadD/HgdB
VLSAVGFTTSIPVEILLAAGKRPVDLNNVFVSREDAGALVQEAEKRGFPAACCAWVKGIYAVIPSLDLDEIIAVVRGDCSQTQALMEVLQMDGRSVYPFAYPYDRSRAAMQLEIKKLQRHFGVRDEAVREEKKRLDRIRRKLKRLDHLTWSENLVSGGENYLYLVSSSDMKGDPQAFERELDGFLAEASNREARDHATEVRLGVIGVPSIWRDLYQQLDRTGVRVVYNEIPRQFSMPAMHRDLAGQYLAFTYPYDVFFRLKDIRREGVRRRIDGFIHYAQAFCFRQIEDRIFRQQLQAPVLTLEGDRPEALDARVRVRLEAFIEMLSKNKELQGPKRREN